MDIIPEKVVEIFIAGHGWMEVKKGSFILTNNFNSSPGFQATVIFSDDMDDTGNVKGRLETIIMVEEDE